MVNKYKLRFKTEPLIIPAIQKLVSVKNSLLDKFKTPKKNNPTLLNVRLTKLCYQPLWNEVKEITITITSKLTGTTLKARGKI